VVPLVLGGGNGPENIVVCCPNCNLKKHSKHPMEFCGRML
jgi:5-methylcytosine-specific restriction endonuclease McrA